MPLFHTDPLSMAISENIIPTIVPANMTRRELIKQIHENSDFGYSEIEAMMDLIFDGIVEGFKDTSRADKSAKSVAASIVSSARGIMSIAKGEDIGKNLIKGVVQGMNKQAQLATSSVTSIFNNLTRIARQTLGIHSPSTVFAEIGKYTVLGMEQGLEEYSNRIYNKTSEMADSAIEGFSDRYESLMRVIDWDDLNPSIKPTMDLSNITEGVKRISSLINDNTEFKAKVNAANQNATSGSNGQTFIQNNYSPKALSRVDIYRQTKNLFSTSKGKATI